MGMTHGLTLLAKNLNHPTTSTKVKWNHLKHGKE